jgi:hypothetical protein
MSNIDACTGMSKSREPPESVAFSSAERGIWWLRSRQRRDGEFAGCADDLAGYYKAILAFSATGRSIPAGRCCRYVTEHFLTSTGELASGDRKTGVVRFERNLANYMNGWVAAGAWSLEAFELAERVVCGLERAQSTRHGGVLTGPAKWSAQIRPGDRGQLRAGLPDHRPSGRRRGGGTVSDRRPAETTGSRALARSVL